MLFALYFAASELSWFWSLFGLLSVPALVVVNGFFVAAEFALVAVRKTRVEEMVQAGERGAPMVASAIAHLDRSIAATQLGITATSIGLGWIGEPALARLLHPLFESLPGIWAGFATHSSATAIAFLLITFMHVVFGELIPKTLALQKPDRTALWIAAPLVVFTKLTRPLIVLMNGTANSIVRWCGFRPARGEQMVHSVEELALAVEDTEEAGLLDHERAEYVQNVLELADRKVGEVLVPVEKMAALELHMPPERILEAVRQGAHTRMPVYEGHIDNIVGIVNTKDLFYLFSLKGVVILHDAMYPPLFLHPNNTVAEALRLFRKARRHMALVRDDKGKILGLITLEDVLEEIVGDIEDEHDRPTPKVKFVRVTTRRAADAKVESDRSGT
ncbi:MAG: membrane protein [Gemmatales bacterium]|nr:MAG: membrane protein [Gemmatales bacterium]